MRRRAWLAAIACAAIAALVVALLLWRRAPAPSAVLQTSPEGRTERAHMRPTVTGRIAPWMYEPGLPSGRIAGRVIDADRRPVSGAAVELVETQLSLLFDRRQHVVSDAEGRFDFGEQPPTRYLVQATHPKHGPSGVHLDLANPEGKPRPDDVTVRLQPCERISGLVVDSEGKPLAAVTVASNGWDGGRSVLVQTGVDGAFDVCGGSHLTFQKNGFGVYRAATGWLHSPVRVVLVPAATVTGTIVGVDGKPVAGALVWAELLYMPEVMTISDAQGRFVLEDVPAGAITLGAEHEVGRSGGTEVTTAMGQTTEVTIELSDTCRRVSGRVVAKRKPVAGVALLGTYSQSDGSFVDRCVATKSVALNVEGWTVEGSTVLPDGEGPIDDVLVEVRPRPTIRGRVTDGGAPFERAAIFEQGGYGELARSDASGVFELRGVSPGSHTYYAIAPRRLKQSAPVEVEVGTKDAAIELVLTSAGSISGLVVGSDGKPVVDATVEAADPGSAPGESWSAGDRPRPGERFRPVEARTDGEGKFSIIGLEPEEYELRTRGLTSKAPWPIVTLAAGEAREDVRLSVDAPGEARIAGRVVRPSGAAVPGAVVDASPGARVVTGGDGSFSLAVSSFSDPVRLEVGTPDGGRRRMAVARGTLNARLIVPSPGAIALTIDDPGDDWDVAIDPVDRGDTSSQFHADVRGHAVTARFLEPGRYTLKVEGRGRSGTSSAEVTEGKTTALTIKLGGVGRVRGHVRTFPAGKVPRDMTCGMTLFGNGSVPVGPDGTFMLVDVVPGPVKIFCETDDGMGVGRGVAIAEQTTEVDVFLLPHLEDGDVSDPGFEPDPKLVVESVTPGGPAAAAGLAVGDHIDAIDGSATKGLEQAAAIYLMTRPPGSTIAVTYTRGGATGTATIKLP